MTVYLWSECSRTVLARILAESLVVLPIGATEQHGPHLPSGTDSILVDAITATAAQRAAERSPRDIVVTPTMPFGSSDHHFPFGATLSLGSETTTQVLVGLLGSVSRCGGTRVLIVNGHGGNRGPCHSAAHIASTRHGIQVAYLDYWAVCPALEVNVPGHAGAFETAMVRQLRPDILGELPSRGTPPAWMQAQGVDIYTQELWRALDGYTDEPAAADPARDHQRYSACADALADRIVAVASGL
jgi:creatinine amidohydrolase